MSEAFEPDFRGQRVKVVCPEDGSLYDGKASYIRFNSKGEVIYSEIATDEQIQWWMSLNQLEALQYEIAQLNESIRAVWQRM